MIEIAPGNLRDITYTAAHMREQDRREVLATAALECASQAGWISYATAEHCWTASYKGQPIAAFGIGVGSSLQPHIRHAWAFGTDRFKRAVPAITRFCREHWPQMMRDAGVWRMEVRSLASHDLAHSWLKACGARRECTLTGYGVNGEDFELWAFLGKDFDDVFQRPKAA